MGKGGRGRRRHGVRVFEKGGRGGGGGASKKGGWGGILRMALERRCFHLGFRRGREREERSGEGIGQKWGGGSSPPAQEV